MTTAAGMGAARAAGAWGAASGSSGSSCCPGRCADRGHPGCGALPAAVCMLYAGILLLARYTLLLVRMALPCRHGVYDMVRLISAPPRANCVKSCARPVAQAAALCAHRCAFQLLPIMPKREILQEVEEAAMWSTIRWGEWHPRGLQLPPRLLPEALDAAYKRCGTITADYAKTFYLVG